MDTISSRAIMSKRWRALLFSFFCLWNTGLLIALTMVSNWRPPIVLYRWSLVRRRPSGRRPTRVSAFYFTTENWLSAFLHALNCHIIYWNKRKGKFIISTGSREQAKLTQKPWYKYSTIIYISKGPRNLVQKPPLYSASLYALAPKTVLPMRVNQFIEQ